MKKKTFIVQLLDSKKPSRTSFTQVEDANFYSNDTDASLVFIPHEDTFDFQSAKVVMFNRGDESLVERDAVVTTEDGRKVASYELPEEIISHWGQWIAQPVFISGGEIYSGAIVPFSVERHLMHERPPKLTEVVTVTKFIQQSQELVNAMIQAEAQRITEEQVRQESETNRVQAESERSVKYESYAQQFNDVIKELSEDKDYHSLPEIAGARRGYSTLAESLGNLSVGMINKNLGKLDQTYMSDELLQQMAGNTPINAVPADGGLTTEKFADKSIKVLKMDNFDKELTNTSNNLVIENNNRSVLNAYGDINSGNAEVVPINVTLDFMDNITPFSDYAKNLRVNYTNLTGNVRFTKKMTLSPPSNWPGYLTFGAWFRGTSLRGMGARRLNHRLIGDSTNYYANWLGYTDLTNVGFENTRENDSYSVTTSVLSSYRDYYYIQWQYTKVPNHSNFEFRLELEGGSSTGTIDLVGITAAETHDNLLPHHVYPISPASIVPTNTELDSDIKSLQTLMDANEFEDIRGNLVGDSLAAPSEGYAMVIENYLGMVNRFNRHAIGGRPLANGTVNGDGANTYGKTWTDGSTIDYLMYQLSLIAVGTNDFKLNVPIGELKSNLPGIYDTTTFIGALQDLIEHILKKNPEINLVLFTPLQRNNDGYSTTSTNTAGHMLIDYVDAMISVGNLYGIPVYDMYRNSGVNHFNLSTYTYDGLHLNGQTSTPGPGYKFVGTKMGKFIKNNVVVI